MNEALRNVGRFKEKWDGQITAAVHQSFELKVHAAYTRAAADEPVLDVEINLAGDAGPALAAAAARGDFSAVLDRHDPEFVQINTGAVFTRELRDAAHLQSTSWAGAPAGTHGAPRGRSRLHRNSGRWSWRCSGPSRTT